MPTRSKPSKRSGKGTSKAPAAAAAPAAPALVRDQNFTADGGGPRRCQCFDAGWKFLRDDAPSAERPDFDDSAWRTLDVPHDWSMEDLPELPPQAAEPALPVTRGTWRFQKGDEAAWKDPAFDDASWQAVNLPAYWESHSNYTEDNVYGWYRRTVEVPAELRGRDFVLMVGKIDDVDETFFNGVKIGGMGTFPPHFNTAWNTPRAYRVPAELVRQDGPNVVAVRVFDGPGGGGIYAEISPPARVGPFDTQASPGGRDTGYVVGGVGWYRKAFATPADHAGGRMSIVFDGVYMNADVWINGQHLGCHPYGYTAFSFDLTRHLRPAGQENVLAVRVNNRGRNSRWYSGSGIYRHTWLVSTGAVHVPLWGVSVTTPKVKPDEAVVRVATTLENAGTQPQDVTLTTSVLGPRGRPAGKAVLREHLAAGQRRQVTQDVKVRRPMLWSPDAPHLYEARTQLAVGKRPADGLRTPFGIRTIRFDAGHGFLLNGQPLKLRGACMHHDNGPLGSAALDRAETRRVELMKANGYNAIRTAHNPPSQVFLDACDRLGMLVMDEAFDMWQVAKNAEDYHRYFDLWWQRDVDSMVLRDRNHPCVIIWSIGNELPERGDAEGFRTAWMLADYVRGLDPTRPVTSAVCGWNPWEITDGTFAALDVGGYNYQRDNYAKDHKRFPRRIIASTESFPPEADLYWMGVLDNAYVIGDFVWTGFDYLGESGIGQATLDGETEDYGFPWHVAYCGDIDICGVKRQQSYYRDILWNRGRKVHIAVHAPLPAGRKGRVSLWGWPDVHSSWTWPGCEGRTMDVTVYSACETVTLVLNGREIAAQATSRATRFQATFAVPYEPGKLVAVGRIGGEVAERHVLRTAGAPRGLRLTCDRRAVFADRNDLCYVTCEVLDDSGQVVPNATDLLKFTVTGPAELAAQANGNPRDAVSYRLPQRKAHEGRCLLVIRPTDQPGEAQVRAEAEGLQAATATIQVKKLPL
jgi:beta-galactosidase